MPIRISRGLAVIVLATLVALVPYATAAAADLRATELVGKKVEGRRGEDFGKVRELVIDLEENRVAYAVMARQGALGIGEKPVALPYGELAIAPGAESVLVERKPQPTKKGQASQESASTGATGMPLRYVRTDQLIGTELREGERKAGRLKDLVFDARSGAVTHAVVVREGMEARVPLSAIRATSKQGRLALELESPPAGTRERELRR
jgi:sporulation protein YlmC with PRC-barrel domain